MAPAGVIEVELWLRRRGDLVLAAIDDDELEVRLDPEEALRIPLELTPRRFARGAGRALDTARSLAAIGARLGEVIAPLLRPRLTTRPLRVRLCGDDFDLLALPWEATLIDEAPLGLLADVQVVREVGSDAALRCMAVPGPLRVLLVVATPHGDPDTAEELGLLLAATGGVPHLEVLDGAAATLDALRERLDHAAFHVVHIAALSRAGALLLEAADGRAAEVSSVDLAEALAGARHPPPLVVLSTRSTGAALEGPGPIHVVPPLLDAGLPRVVALQGTVDAAYAADLARALYAELLDPALAVPAEALTTARIAVDRAGQGTAAVVPAHASPALFVARGLAGRPLGAGDPPLSEDVAPAITIEGFTPLARTTVLARRSLRRDLHDALVRPRSRGAQLIGEAGLGKSDLALDVLGALVRDEWSVAAIHGAFAVVEVARAVAAQVDPLRLSPAGRRRHASLGSATLSETTALAELSGLLASEALVLVFAEFADNLLPDDRLPVGVARALQTIAGAAARGAVLLVTRRRIVGPGDLLTPLVVDPLPASASELLLRSSAVLRALDPADRAALHAACAGRPRLWRLAAQLPAHAWPAVRMQLSPEAAEDVLVEALLADLDAGTRRFHAAIAVVRRAASARILAELAAAVGLEWDEARRDLAVSTLVARGLLLPVHASTPQWRPLRRGAGEPAAHAALARALWHADTRWADGLAAIDHWLAADAPAEAHACARWMIEIAEIHGYLLAAAALSERLAGIPASERADWHSLARAHTARLTSPVAELTSARRDHAREQAAATRELIGDDRERCLVVADRELASVLIDFGELERAGSLLSASLNRIAARSDADAVYLEALRVTALLAAVARARGNWQEACRLLASCQERSEEQLRRRPEHGSRTLLAWSAIDLADLYLTHGDGIEAARRGQVACTVTAGHGDRESLLANAVAQLRRADAGLSLSLAAAAEQLEQALKTLRGEDFGGPLFAASRRALAEALMLHGAVELQYARSAAARIHLEEAARLLVGPANRGGADLLLRARVTVGLAEARAAVGAGEPALACLVDIHAALESQGPAAEPPRDLQRERWRVHLALGSMHLQRGSLAEARRHLGQGLAIGVPLVEREPEATDLVCLLVHSCLAMAAISRVTEDLPAPLHWLRDALESADSLTRREPARCDFKLLLARVHGELAEYHRQSDDLARAQAHAETYRKFADELAAAETTRTDLQRARAAARWTLAALALAVRDRATARRLADVGRALTDVLADRDPDRLDFAYDQLCWAGILGLEPGETGERHLLAGCTRARELAERDPTRVDVVRRWWVLSSELGRRRHGGLSGEARSHLRFALELATRLVARQPDNDLAHAALAESCADLARVDRDDAVALLTRSVEAQRVRRAAAPSSAPRLRALARSLTELGKVVSGDLAARALWIEARVLLTRITTRERHDVELLAWLDHKLGPET